MGSTSDEIEHHIESTREDLRSNLQELEGRVKSVADWRQHYRNKPGVALGIAFGGGLLLAGLLGGSRARSNGYHAPAPPRGATRGHVLRAWDNIQSALVGIAASRVADGLARVVAHFGEQFARPATPQASREHSGDGVHGEGNYRAARRYRTAAERFAHLADVERTARQAAPRSEAEAQDMAEAEAAGRSHAKPS